MAEGKHENAALVVKCGLLCSLYGTCSVCLCVCVCVCVCARTHVHVCVCVCVCVYVCGV